MLPSRTHLTQRRIKLCVLILIVASCALISDRVLTGQVSAAAMNAASPLFANQVVTNLNDSGAGSLRQAIANVGAGETITFAVTGTITLTTGELVISKSLTIQGPGANLLTVSGNNNSRVFSINDGTVMISGLTITGGNGNGATGAGSGGGIFNDNMSSLTLANIAVIGNMATIGIGGGGGIYNRSLNPTTLTNSTVSGNRATDGGGIFNFFASMTITNCTFSGNSAINGVGGGIGNNTNPSSFPFGKMTLTNSTVVANTATNSYGGIYNQSFDGLNIRSSIIAKNTAPTGPDLGGTFTSQGYNLIGNTSGTIIIGVTTGNILNVDPLVGPLQNNGGPTFTHALLPGSPAIDKGINNSLATDQRGFPRLVDIASLANAPGGDGTDIGAFEFQFSDLSAANLGPGSPVPIIVPLSDQKAGSVLFYNYYSSSPTNLSAENTRLNLTNADPLRSVAVHLFFVDGTTCSPADAFVCLTPSQTISFLASDFDPGTTGYVVAVAVDQNGCPLNFNFLIGDEFIKLSSGHTANLGAESFAAISNVNVCAPGALTAALNFDGVSYNAAPRVLALDNFPSPLEASTLLIVNRFGGNLLSGASTIGALTGVLYDESEQAFSFAFTPPSCQFKGSLNTSIRILGGGLSQVVGVGRSGWMRFWAVEDRALLGAALIASTNVGTNAFTGGHNLHKLTFTTTASLTMPIIVPGC